MNNDTLSLILGIVLAGTGMWFLFFKKYSSELWKSKARTSPIGIERTTRLAKFQGLIIFVIGVDLMILGITGHDLIVEVLSTIHL